MTVRGRKRAQIQSTYKAPQQSFFLNVCVCGGGGAWGGGDRAGRGLGGGEGASGRALAIITTHVKYMSALYLSLNY